MEITERTETLFWNEFFSRIILGSDYLDEEFNITQNAILYTLQSKELSIDFSAGSKDELLRKFNNESKNPFVKFNLKGKDGLTAELIYYFPRVITDRGNLFLSEDGGKTLTEFVSFQKVDTSTSPIKEKGLKGKKRDFYTKTIGTKITTISIRPEGMYVEELEIPYISEDREGLEIINGEASNTVKFYSANSTDEDSIDILEGLDLGKHMIEIKVRDTENNVRIKKVSIVKQILKKLRSQIIKSDKDEGCSSYKYYVGKIKINKDHKDLYYLKNYLKMIWDEKRKALLRILEEPSKSIEQPKVVEPVLETELKEQQKKSEPEKQQETEPEESVEEEVPPKELDSPDLESKKPILLSSEVEEKLFSALLDRIKRSSEEKDDKIFSRTLIEILKLEGLHFKMVEGVPIIKSITDWKIAEEGFELIDQNGRVYKLFEGDFYKIATLVGEDKIINIKYKCYSYKTVPSYGDWGVEVPESFGYEITTIGVKNGGVYKNENNICYTREYDDKKGNKNGFFTKPIETEYYSKDLLLALGMNLEDLIQHFLFQIKFRGNDDVFAELHKFGTDFAAREVKELPFDRKQIFKEEFWPLDDDEFYKTYIMQNLGFNYEAIEKFLSQQLSQRR